MIKAKTGQKVGKNKKEGVKKSLFLIFVGSIIGFINGLLGGGGGMICVPLLEKSLKLPSKKAHATAIAVIFPLSFVSSAIYIYNGAISSQPLLISLLGVVAGGVLGAFLLKFLPPKVIGIIFSILMIGAGVRLVI